MQWASQSWMSPLGYSWFNKNPAVLSLNPDYSQVSIKVYNNSLSMFPCATILSSKKYLIKTQQSKDNIPPGKMEWFTYHS